MRVTKGDRVIFILIIVLLLMGVGYAYLTTSLNINGTADVVGANWSVHFDNIRGIDGDFEIDPEIGVSGTDISYEANLEWPGVYAKFNVDIVNDGSVDAMIGSINSTINNQPISTLPDYLFYSVTYPDGEEVGNNYLLEAGKSLTYTVLIKYRDDIEPSQLPTNNYAHNIHINIDFLQASGDVPSWKFNGIVYSYDVRNVPVNGTLDDINGWSLEAPELLNDYYDPGYLKFNIVNHNISSTHIMIYWGDDTFKEIIPGIENRESNIELFRNHFGASYCYNDYSTAIGRMAFMCDIDPNNPYNPIYIVSDDGSVGYYSCGKCMAFADGSSTCYVDVC